MVVTFFVRYTAWHYTQAPSLLFKLWANLLWYLGHVFSISALWHSLFSPWKRIVAKHTKRWDIEDYASAVLANFISRVIGAIMRLTLITTGRLLQLCLVLFGIFVYIVWFIMPVFVVSMFMLGLYVIL